MELNDRFIAIGKGIHLKTGQRPIVENDHPTVILIFGWMAAQPSHLYKYSQGYDILYPQATQILVRCELSFFWSSTAATQLALEPVLDVLEALGCVYPASRKSPNYTDNPHTRILVHSFSNGGASQLTTLGKLLTSRSLVSPPLTTAYIIDSAPGSSDLARTKLSFTAHIPSRPIRMLAAFFVTILYGILKTLNSLNLIEDPTVVLTHALLNEDHGSLCMPPFLTTATPRLYIYSRTDALIPYDDVQAHIHAAKEKGMVVKDLVFGKSAHVAHARTDPERYWAGVKDIWEEGVRMHTRRERSAK